MTEDELRADIARRCVDVAEATTFRRIKDIDVESFRRDMAKTFGVALQKVSASATSDGVLRAHFEP